MEAKKENHLNIHGLKGSTIQITIDQRNTMHASRLITAETENVIRVHLGAI